MTKETQKLIAESSATLKFNVKVLARKKFSSFASLARKLGISAPSLSHALNGNIRLDTLVKIANALDVSIATLFKERNPVEGYVIINGEKTKAFSSLKELESVLEEARERENREFAFDLVSE